MGNQSSTQNHIDIGDLATNYSYEVKYTDSRFGEIKLLRRKDTGDKIFQKDFTTNVSKEFEDYINKIKSRIPLLHPNILKILGYNSRKEDLLCADFFKISLFFEAFETDLEKEIYRRHVTEEYFSETELRCLLDSIISACAYLQKNQVSPFILLKNQAVRLPMVTSDPIISLSPRTKNIRFAKTPFSNQFTILPTSVSSKDWKLNPITQVLKFSSSIKAQKAKTPNSTLIRMIYMDWV